MAKRNLPITLGLRGIRTQVQKKWPFATFSEGCYTNEPSFAHFCTGTLKVPLLYIIYISCANIFRRYSSIWIMAFWAFFVFTSTVILLNRSFWKYIFKQRCVKSHIINSRLYFWKFKMAIPTWQTKRLHSNENTSAKNVSIRDINILNCSSRVWVVLLSTYSNVWANNHYFA